MSLLSLYLSNQKGGRNEPFISCLMFLRYGNKWRRLAKTIVCIDFGLETSICLISIKQQRIYSSAKASLLLLQQGIGFGFLKEVKKSIIAVKPNDWADMPSQEIKNKWL